MMTARPILLALLAPVACAQPSPDAQRPPAPPPPPVVSAPPPPAPAPAAASAPPPEPVTAAYLAAGEWSVEIAGRRYPAMASMRPLYDPSNERVRA